MKQHVMRTGVVLTALLLMIVSWRKPGQRKECLQGELQREKEAVVYLSLLCEVPAELLEDVKKRIEAKKEGASGKKDILGQETEISLEKTQLVLRLRVHVNVAGNKTVQAGITRRPAPDKTVQGESTKDCAQAGTNTETEGWRIAAGHLIAACRELTLFRPKSAVILAKRTGSGRMTQANKNGGYLLSVTESRNGFALDAEKTMLMLEEKLEGLEECLQKCGAEYAILTVQAETAVIEPKLSTEVAKKCNTLISEFSTSYEGAGNGRARNISAGASHLNGKIILPGEEFSTAAALMPFSVENGYTAGGTYINGELSESLGGGVCQLSTTLYNAALQTKLTVTKRSAHSMPVAYVPLGRDAAIAGDYKDLCFQNTTGAPVLLLCEATGKKVTVSLYGTGGAKRNGVWFEQIKTKETSEEVWVETYRGYIDENGVKQRDLVGESRYRYLRGSR